MTYKDLIDIDSYDEFTEKIVKANLPLHDELQIRRERADRLWEKYGVKYDKKKKRH